MRSLSFSKLANFTEDQAREYLESIRWSNGVVCPHCKSTGASKFNPVQRKNRKPQNGLYRCTNKPCNKQFTVTVGTVCEGSHIPLNKWLMAMSLLCSSKKGMSAHQLHRMLGVTYKTAWFMAHRIRHAMTQDLSEKKFAGIVEIDEGYIGAKAIGKTGRGATDKAKVVVLVERDGRVKSEIVDKVTSVNLKEVLKKNVSKQATLYTDGFYPYRRVGREFNRHIAIIGTKEGVGPRRSIHINTAENFIGILKRGIGGVYQHVSKKHLDKYLAEFDFRYSMRDIQDNERTTMAMLGIEGKRLYYKEGVNGREEKEEGKR
ncbi:IS1595 family transposase [candidate division KSB1 bacterium]